MITKYSILKCDYIFSSNSFTLNKLYVREAIGLHSLLFQDKQSPYSPSRISGIFFWGYLIFSLYFFFHGTTHSFSKGGVCGYTTSPHLFPVVACILSVICSIQDGLRMWNLHHIVVKSSINLWRHCLTAAEGGFLVCGILWEWGSLWGADPCGAGERERIQRGIWPGTWLLSEFVKDDAAIPWNWLINDCSFLLYSSRTYHSDIPCHFCFTPYCLIL